MLAGKAFVSTQFSIHQDIQITIENSQKKELYELSRAGALGKGIECEKVPSICNKDKLDFSQLESEKQTVGVDSRGINLKKILDVGHSKAKEF